jgi:hypothetical protein
MVEGGVETICGGKRDPSFGPVIMFGFGGIYVESLNNVAFRVAPIRQEDALEMIEELRGSRILLGARGRKSLDIEGAVEALLSISNLLLKHDNLIEFEINPLILTQDSAIAVDARAFIAPNDSSKA